MITKNDDISSWENLPADLLILLRNVQYGAFAYPERESDWAQMLDYLQNGNHSMATFKLEQMLIHQNNLRG